jgi:uncharacterized membrane protein YoaK (UPF0700 family)
MDDDVLEDLTLATVLLIIAGFVDAVGFLTLGHLFVSFASGNSTQFAIGVGAGGVPWSKASAGGALVGFFVAGVAGGKVLAIAAKDWRRPAILIAEAVLLGAAALVPLSGLRAAFLMAAAMGGQNAVLHKAGRTRTALTYVTGTLVNLGERLAEAVCRAGPARAWVPYLILWIGIISGGAVGAIAYAGWGIRALLVPTAGVVILVTATGASEWRRRRRR